MAEEAPTSTPGTQDAVDADDAALIDRAARHLSDQRGYDLPEARNLLLTVAARAGRRPADTAREVLAGATDLPSAALIDLSSIYLDIADAIGTAPADRALRRVTTVAVDRVPGAAWASITLLARHKLTTVAATNPAANAADRLQYQLHEGPCVAAVDTPSAYLAPDLATEPRWPTYAQAVRNQVGVHGMLSHRLGLDVDDLDNTVASLNLYATEAGALGTDDVLLGTLLAAHASTAVIASQYQHRVNRLETALDTNREVGMAMGILIQRHRVTRDRAFALLRIASQHANRKLRDIATDLVDTGVLDLPPMKADLSGPGP